MGLSVYALRKGAINGRFPAIRAGNPDSGKILFDRTFSSIPCY